MSRKKINVAAGEGRNQADGTDFQNKEVFLRWTLKMAKI